MNDSYSMFNATQPGSNVFTHDRAVSELANIPDLLVDLQALSLPEYEDEMSALRIDVDRAVRSVDYAITEAE